MKLLLYTRVFPPDVGGVEAGACLIAECVATAGPLGDERLDVTVLTGSQPAVRGDDKTPYKLVRSRSRATLVRLMHEADLVHLVGGPSLGALSVAVAMRKPTLVHHHTYQAACPNGLLLFGPDLERCPGWFLKRRYDKCLTCAIGKEGLRRRAKELAVAGPRRAAPSGGPQHHGDRARTHEAGVAAFGGVLPGIEEWP